MSDDLSLSSTALLIRDAKDHDTAVGLLRGYVDARLRTPISAFQDLAAYCLDLTITILTTEPWCYRGSLLALRAYTTHRRALAYRKVYSLKSRAEIENDCVDSTMDKLVLL